jgi:hypothetical protein
METQFQSSLHGPVAVPQGERAPGTIRTLDGPQSRSGRESKKKNIRLRRESNPVIQESQ